MMLEQLNMLLLRDKKQLFVGIVEALISRENTLWMTIHRRRENNEETQTD